MKPVYIFPDLRRILANLHVSIVSLFDTNLYSIFHSKYASHINMLDAIRDMEFTNVRCTKIGSGWLLLVLMKGYTTNFYESQKTGQMGTEFLIIHIFSI